MRNKTEVFVYGTLKRGGRLHHCLTDSEYVGEGVVRGKMYDVGAFPALIHSDSVAGRWVGDNKVPTPDHSYVRGEIYSVDADTLQHLDIVEGVPMLYRRESVEFYHVEVGDGVTNGPKDQIMDICAGSGTVQTYLFNRLSDDMPRIETTERATCDGEVFFIAHDVERR